MGVLVGENLDNKGCELIAIDDKDKIMKIKVWRDDYYMRRLVAHMASGGTVVVGKKEELKELHTHTYDFTDKIDLMGAYGFVTSDPQDTELDRIIGLSFLVNDCPVRKLLEYEVNYLAQKKIEEDAYREKLNNEG